MTPFVSRRRALAAGAALLAAPAARRASAATVGKPERTKLTLGIAAESTTYIGVYLASERTWKEAGLDVTVLTFRGESEETQALAGGSIDISSQGIDGLIDLIDSGEPVTAFYAGFNQADFAWLAQPTVHDWSGLRGGSVGISTYGSVTDQLTRYVLRKHGLEPDRDVHIIQAGSPASNFPGFKAGRMTAAIESVPYKWIAQDSGMTLLGTQAQEVAPAWPKDAFVTMRRFLDENPNTIKTFLRGYVAALRLLRSNRDLAIATMIDHLKFDRKYADRAYDQIVPGFDERGRLPDRKTMDTYWRIKIESGLVKQPWPAAKFMDARFMTTFNQWAP